MIRGESWRQKSRAAPTMVIQMRRRQTDRPLPSEIEEYRDVRWRRENSSSIETAAQAEEFTERVGFAACLIDACRPGPSLYVAVCGRRDAIMPRNVPSTLDVQGAPLR